MKIEDVCNPIIGETYLVRCVLTRRSVDCNKPLDLPEETCWFPILDKAHADVGYGQPKPHYHVDWRFVRQEHIDCQEDAFKRYVKLDIQNSHYLAPVMQDEMVREEYFPLVYFRHFRQFPANEFPELKEAMKNAKMKGMKCPHHNYDLRSCQVVEGVVTCPMHGLKWDVKTGKLK